jgi:hypothetical protein
MLERAGAGSTNVEEVSSAPAARIFTACHGTQLLVVQHLRRHLQRPPAREFLIWHPMDDNSAMEGFMRGILAAPAFDDTLDMRDFQSLEPRTQGPLAWWLESARRLRSDARNLHAWIDTNGIDDRNAELWADEPLHFHVYFTRGALKRARHVKIPHCFNHEDSLSPVWKQNLETGWASVSWAKRHLFQRWQRWATGVDLRMERLVYDRAYTFALPSPWSANSIDLSSLISLKAFSATYRGLPASMRAEVEAELAPISAGPRPLILLPLFGLGESDAFRTVYQRAMARLFEEHAAELRGCTLAVKLHPGANGKQESVLIDWLRANIPVQVHEIRRRLNLEFMLPRLQPDYVMAGLCGSLPIVRDLRAGRPIMISEWLDLYLADYPWQRQAVHEFLQGIEIW